MARKTETRCSLRPQISLCHVIQRGPIQLLKPKQAGAQIPIRGWVVVDSRKCVSLSAHNFFNPVQIPGQALQFLGLFSLLVHNSSVSLLVMDSELQSQHKLDCLTSLQQTRRFSVLSSLGLLCAHNVSVDLWFILDKHIRKHFVTL